MLLIPLMQVVPEVKISIMALNISVSSSNMGKM